MASPRLFLFWSGGSAPGHIVGETKSSEKGRQAEKHKIHEDTKCAFEKRDKERV